MPIKNEDDVMNPKPQPPREPEPAECCQNGCEPCVYDRYWDACERYEQALANWESMQLRHATTTEKITK